jgi:predicted NBD/HSP70 family sugar kinase
VAAFKAPYGRTESGVNVHHSGSGLRVGIDIGGTTIDAIIVDRLGSIVARTSVPTRVGEDFVILDCVDIVHALLAATPTTRREIERIGIGVPGVVDHELGLVRNAVNVGLLKVALADRISSELDIPVSIDNDVNAATLGAVDVYTPSPHGSLAFLNVGTGLSGGFFSGGRLLRGHRGLVGELGHLPAHDLTSAPCRCGSRACLETVASGSALAHAWSDESLDFGAALDRGHARAVEIWARLMSGVVRSLELMTLMWDPEIIVIGGGVVRHHERFGDDLRRVWGDAALRSSVFASSDLADRVHVVDPERPLGAIGATHIAGLSPAVDSGSVHA